MLGLEDERRYDYDFISNEYNLKYAINYIHEVIPENRTCEHLVKYDIKEHACICKNYPS